MLGRWSKYFQLFILREKNQKTKVKKQGNGTSDVELLLENEWYVLTCWNCQRRLRVTGSHSIVTWDRYGIDSSTPYGFIIGGLTTIVSRATSTSRKACSRFCLRPSTSRKACSGFCLRPSTLQILHK